MQKFIENLFNISHDASASLIVTLSTFILGYLITGFVVLITRYFVRRTNRKMFNENMQSLNKSIKRQLKAFKHTIATLDIMKSPPWIYTRADFFQVNVFKEMSYKENFKSFFLGLENQLPFCTNQKLKRKAYNKAWENLNNIQFWSDRGFDSFYPALDKFNQHGERRNEAMTRLRKMWEHIIHQAQIAPNSLTPIEFEYVKALDKIIGSAQKIPTNERVLPFRTHRSMILPIRILNRKFHTIGFVREINDTALEVSHHYLEMENLVRHTRIQYQDYAYSFRSILKTNEKIIRILN